MESGFEDKKQKDEGKKQADGQTVKTVVFITRRILDKSKTMWWQEHLAPSLQIWSKTAQWLLKTNMRTDRGMYGGTDMTGPQCGVYLQAKTHSEPQMDHMASDTFVYLPNRAGWRNCAMWLFRKIPSSPTDSAFLSRDLEYSAMNSSQMDVLAEPSAPEMKVAQVWPCRLCGIVLGLSHLLLGIALLIFDVVTNYISETAFAITASLSFIVCGIFSFISARFISNYSFLFILFRR